MVLYEIALFEIQATPTKTPKINKIKNQNIETITKTNRKNIRNSPYNTYKPKIIFRRKCQQQIEFITRRKWKTRIGADTP